MKHFQFSAVLDGKKIRVFGEFESISEAARKISTHFEDQGKVITDVVVKEIEFFEDEENKIFTLEDIGKVHFKKECEDGKHYVDVTLSNQYEEINSRRLALKENCELDEAWSSFNSQAAAEIGRDLLQQCAIQGVLNSIFGDALNDDKPCDCEICDKNRISKDTWILKGALRLTEKYGYPLKEAIEHSEVCYHNCDPEIDMVEDVIDEEIHAAIN